MTAVKSKKTNQINQPIKQTEQIKYSPAVMRKEQLSNKQPWATVPYMDRVLVHVLNGWLRGPPPPIHQSKWSKWKPR